MTIIHRLTLFLLLCAIVLAWVYATLRTVGFFILGYPAFGAIGVVVVLGLSWGYWTLRNWMEDYEHDQ